ncbi:hypothetical protein QE379_003264 [Sphingomonas sp. SORGH_AS 879]|nr:hypothetical protein [Sphingomonas sp. SORGH_AS_0879]
MPIKRARRGALALRTRLLAAMLAPMPPTGWSIW